MGIEVDLVVLTLSVDLANYWPVARHGCDLRPLISFDVLPNFVLALTRLLWIPVLAPYPSEHAVTVCLTFSASSMLAIAKVDSRWAGGRFRVRIDQNSILVSAAQAAALQRAGVIPAG